MRYRRNANDFIEFVGGMKRITSFRIEEFCGRIQRCSATEIPQDPVIERSGLFPESMQIGKRFISSCRFYFPIQYNGNYMGNGSYRSIPNFGWMRNH